MKNSTISNSILDQVPNHAQPAPGEPDHKSRVVFHAFAAIIATGLLCGFLSFFTFYKHYFHRRQMNGIQSSAVVDLRLVFDAEQKFYKERGFYTTDLLALKIQPKAVLYKFGFAHAGFQAKGVEDLDPGRMDLDALKLAKPNLIIEYSTTTGLAKIDFHKVAASFCNECTASADHFKVMAAANLSQGATLDIWTIDELGKVTHVLNDLN